jgi:hypothetical protein
MKQPVRKKGRNSTLNRFISMILGLLSLVYVYPFLMVLINSVKKKIYISRMPFALPDAKTYAGFTNYQTGISRTDFPVLTCAAGWVNGAYKVAVGARPGCAVVVRDEEGLLASGNMAESADAFADYAAAHITTGANVRGSAEYRTHLVRVLTKRALLGLEE